ncbi:MAG: N-acetyltransferase [Hyphomicrobiales bacterium]|nr:N-acetyltransferase [Hyphomicrobiales bacterium]MCP5374297.1 N-acetyltransferase [Hyphomicrobiales bacterium]
MPDGTERTQITVLPAIDEIPAAEWDACAGDGDPFLSHAFLAALERSGSAGAEAGWAPQHLVIEDGDGRAAACAPLYLKNHSYGEYVFDWSWAEAYHRAGGRYYPKLQCAVPFTPATGRRLLLRPGAAEKLEVALMGGMVELARQHGASSVHVTFPTRDQWRRFGQQGWLLRLGQQYHWENAGYRDFDDFLDALSSRKRKTLRKERREVVEAGIRFRVLSGADIQEAHWDTFFRFYLDTHDRKWGQNYLNRKFFSLLGEAMADRVVLVLAEADGRAVAGALNLRGGDTLFGRYWGCRESYKFLHFETCYYQAIDYAIAHGLRWVEAGAQGPHKIQRGYLPRATYSAHWIADPGLREAISRYLDHERPAVEAEIAELAQRSPYKRDDG